MSGTKMIVALILAFSLSAMAYPPEHYLNPGRADLFDGTLTGVREAAGIFDQAAADPDCADSREVRFFHALSRIALWAARDDGGEVNSLMELVRRYGVTVSGDWIRDLVITVPDIPKNRYDSYDIPADAEARLADLLDFLGQTALPELDSVIAELDQIQDSPADRFRVFLTPAETAAFLDPLAPPLTYDVEVDYGEVLLIKGVLLCVKANLEAQAAWDLTISPEDQLLEKVYGDAFSVNRDLLDPHPGFLTLLPTANDPGDGKAALAQAKSSWLFGLHYYLDAINYILSENDPAGADPQDDELLWFDPADFHTIHKSNEIVQTLIDSLENDTTVSLPTQVDKTFDLQTSRGEPLGALTLGFDTLDTPVSEGTLNLLSDPDAWEVTSFELWDDDLYIDLERYDDFCGWNYGYIWGLMSPDRTQLLHCTLNYWDCTTGYNKTFNGFLSETAEETVTGDLNPVFGSSARYPDPVSPRDLLPEFDAWNNPQPGTIGRGLADDPTLGGILPGMTQDDWSDTGDFQPGGIRYWQEIEPWQKDQDWVAFWTDEQCVFTDRLDDVEDEDTPVPGTDIHQLYLGCDSDYLHGCVVLADPPQTGSRSYEITFSPSPFNPKTIGALRLIFHIESGPFYTTNLYQYVSENGYGYWQNQYPLDMEMLQEQNLINFKLSLNDLPVPLWGSYLTVDSYWHSDTWDQFAEDENPTRIRLDLFETPTTVSGTVNYPGYIGAPIYIQAYMDRDFPEDSLIASTMITQPGPFTLEGIGLGAQCYLRAFTPLFGFDPLDPEALIVQDVTRFSQYQQTVGGVLFDLEVPPLLLPGQAVSDSYNPIDDFEEYFAFDALESARYYFNHTAATGDTPFLVMLDRNGGDPLLFSSSNTFEWLCPVSGRYYVCVYYPDYATNSGTYQLLMSSNLALPAADISGGQWTGVKDGRVDLFDLHLLAANWREACSDPYWCDEADYNRDSAVDLDDLVFLVSEWMTSGVWL